MNDLYLLCRDCSVVHRLRVADQLATRDPVSEEAVIAYGEFLTQHRHHATERLERTRLLERGDGPLWEPMRASYIELTNGHETYTVRTARSAIDEPPLHTVVTGRIPAEVRRVTVEEAAIRRALDRHFHPYALRATKIDRFVEAVQEVLARLPGDQVETTFDDADDPAVSIARLPDDGCTALLARCVGIFDAWEMQRVATFISTNRDEYGALALRIRHESGAQAL